MDFTNLYEPSLPNSTLSTGGQYPPYQIRTFFSSLVNSFTHMEIKWEQAGLFFWYKTWRHCTANSMWKSENLSSLDRLYKVRVTAQCKTFGGDLDEVLTGEFLTLLDPAIFVVWHNLPLNAAQRAIRMLLNIVYRRWSTKIIHCIFNESDKVMKQIYYWNIYKRGQRRKHPKAWRNLMDNNNSQNAIAAANWVLEMDFPLLAQTASDCNQWQERLWCLSRFLISKQHIY